MRLAYLSSLPSFPSATALSSQAVSLTISASRALILSPRFAMSETDKMRRDRRWRPQIEWSRLKKLNEWMNEWMNEWACASVNLLGIILLFSVSSFFFKRAGLYASSKARSHGRIFTFFLERFYLIFIHFLTERQARPEAFIQKKNEHTIVTLAFFHFLTERLMRQMRSFK